MCRVTASLLQLGRSLKKRREDGSTVKTSSILKPSDVFFGSEKDWKAKKKNGRSCVKSRRPEINICARLWGIKQLRWVTAWHSEPTQLRCRPFSISLHVSSVLWYQLGDARSGNPVLALKSDVRIKWKCDKFSMNLFDLCINAGVASGRLEIQIEGVWRERVKESGSLQMDTRLQSAESLRLVSLTMVSVSLATWTLSAERRLVGLGSVLFSKA